jgi:cyclophilin family peptidyl-prolyl cis-trans isomerase
VSVGETTRRALLALLCLSIPATALAEIVRIETPLGSFDVELFEEDAPKTVENFLNYVRDGDFENSFFHRSIPGFVLQGGGFTFVDGQVDSVPTDPPVDNEFNQSNLRGTLAMAKVGGDPDSATSQWFVNLADNSDNLDTQNGGFTVFGRVLGDGMDVVDAIAALPRWRFNVPFDNWPLIDYRNQGPVETENIVFTDVTLLETARTELDVTGVVDVSGDAVPDMGYLTSEDQPKVSYYSGATGQRIRTVRYLGMAWTGVAAATLADANANGVAQDPAVAVLATRPDNGRHTVEIRRSKTGKLLKRIDFMGPATEVLDVAVIDDSNGDGVTDDAVIAVLGFNPNRPSKEQIRVQVRRFGDGGGVKNYFFFNENWTPVALEGVQRPGRSPLLAVLGNNKNNGQNVVQARALKNGTLQPNVTFLNDAWLARDLAVLTDTNSDGDAKDPSYLVLGNHKNTGGNRVQTRRVSNGNFIRNVAVNGPKWEAYRLMRVDDISGNLAEEVGTLATRRADGTVNILVKDYADGTTSVKASP